MFVNGEIKEARLQDSMAMCFVENVKLKDNIQNQLLINAGKGKAELEDNIDGSKSIKKNY